MTTFKADRLSPICRVCGSSQVLSYMIELSLTLPIWGDGHAYIFYAQKFWSGRGLRHKQTLEGGGSV